MFAHLHRWDLQNNVQKTEKYPSLGDSKMEALMLGNPNRANRGKV